MGGPFPLPDRVSETDSAASYRSLGHYRRSPPARAPGSVREETAYPPASGHPADPVRRSSGIPYLSHLGRFGAGAYRSIQSIAASQAVLTNPVTRQSTQSGSTIGMRTKINDIQLQAMSGPPIPSCRIVSKIRQNTPYPGEGNARRYSRSWLAKRRESPMRNRPSR